MPQPFIIPVDSKPTERTAWVLLAKAAADGRLVNEAVSLAQLQGTPSPGTPGHYLAVLQAYRDTGGFPNPFTDQEMASLDNLIQQLEVLGVPSLMPSN